MTNPTIPQTVRFPDLFDKPLVATFDREQASSDGGAVLLKAAERVYGLVKAFARCLVDKRAPEKIRHTLEDLVGQRVFGIACGHPDGNDADHLADDPIHKLLLGRDPVAGGRLASQPTISRFENDAGRSALYRMGRELAASVIERHRRRLNGRARRITIDLDPTDDRTHGAQQLTFFNSHYDSWCYLPLLAFVRFDREVEQYLCAAVLRPGKAVAADGTLGVLSRLLPLLRCAFPRARVLVRLDGGFATPGSKSSTFSTPSRGSTTSWRWPRTPSCCGTPRPPWSRRGPRARRTTRRRTSTPTPVAIERARGTMSAVS